MQQNEATLAAECYRILVNAGFRVIMEYKMPSNYHRSGFMRVDAAIVDEANRILAVIEVKRQSKAVASSGRQFQAYSDLLNDAGIQTFWVNSLEKIEEVLAHMKSRL